MSCGFNIMEYCGVILHSVAEWFYRVLRGLLYNFAY